MLLPTTQTLAIQAHEVVFGFFMIGLVLGVNGIINMSMIHFFRSTVGTASKPTRLRANIFFIICVQILAIAQLAAISIWAIALLFVGIFPDWLSAVLFTASSYTTLGDTKIMAPDGWYLIPYFIAFSGLFSFSWAATSTISMINSLYHFLDSGKSSIDHSAS